MIAAVKVAVDYVQDILDDYPDAILVVEQEFQIPSLAAPDEVWGINDICIYIPSMRLLYVIDYKHGAGVPVETIGNEQVRGYGIGALHSHPEWGVDTVALVIIQPRIFNFKLPIPEEWVSETEIWAFRDKIDDAIRAAQEPDAPLVVGEKQCFFCPAKATCPARQQQMLTVAGETFGDVQQVTPAALAAAETLTPDRLAYILDAGDLVRDYIEAVRAEAFRRAMAGTHIPGRKVVEAQARRSWEKAGSEQENAQTAVELFRISGLPPDKFMETKLVGITEAEKLMKDAVRERATKGKKKEAVEEAVAKMAFLTTKKSSGTLSLVAEDDPRPGKNMATEAFSGAVNLPQIGTDQ
jgi:hypothetical protein